MQQTHPFYSLITMKQLTILFLSACIALPAAAQKKVINLSILETSDVHGSFFPYEVTRLHDATPTIDDVFAQHAARKGSMARISFYVNQLRQQMGKNVILLDNGDILQGQPTSYYYNFVATKKPNIAAEVINYMRYDAETIGNHDIEPGHEVYDKWMKEVKCPVLACNVINKKTGHPYTSPYTILHREGVKIAIIGMLTPAIPNWLTEDIWAGLRFDDMVTSARKWMKIVQAKEHPDVVIGLFHSGREGGITTKDYQEDASLRVAREVPGFDIVMFGHDHTRYNQTLTNKVGKKVLCINPANNALTVAQANVQLTLEKGRVTHKTITGTLVDVSDLPIDKAYMTHFTPHFEQVAQFVSRNIGTFTNTITTRDSYFGSSAFNDFIANLMLQITHADIAFNAPLQFDATIKAGPVCVGDMFKLYKYENQLYVMRLTGEEIRKHLEMSYDQWVNTMQSPTDHLLLLANTRGDAQRLGFKNFTFNFDAATGIDYVVDVTKPNGEKVKILRMSNGQPFDEHAWYNVAINSYRGNGGGELLTKGAGIAKDSLKTRIVYRSPRDQRYYLMKEIEKLGTVHPQANHNWKFIPEAWTKPAAQRDSLALFGQAINLEDIK